MKGQLYIPDISGFSKFVNETDLLHGQGITVELLKTIIINNKLNLEIYEIEGDAVVFVNFEGKLNPSDFIDNSKKISDEFYKKTKALNEATRCECNACGSILNLGLKFIVHEDVLNYMEVMNYKKLYGKALIVAHKLLKNKIAKRDYILFTMDYLDSSLSENINELINYSHIDPILGTIKTKYLELK